MLLSNIKITQLLNKANTSNFQPQICMKDIHLQQANKTAVQETH